MTKRNILADLLFYFSISFFFQAEKCVLNRKNRLSEKGGRSEGRERGLSEEK